MTLPLAANFPKLPPRAIPPWVWERFLKALRYLESLRARRDVTSANTPYWHFLGHEIKRTEIEVGLWLGRMMEIEQEFENGTQG